jgi:group I intron endonuclease
MSKITQSAIYMFKNTINSKIYVGQSVDVYSRYSKHKKSEFSSCINPTRFVNAIKKYGFNNFEFSIIEFVEKENLTIREQFWMDFYKSYLREFGYNACPAAGSPFGYKHTKETREKVSIASKGRLHSEKTKKLMSEIHTGKKMSIESIKKNRVAKLGKKVPNKRGIEVEQVCKKTGDVICKFISATSAHKHIGGGISPILATCRGERKSAGGYLWRFSCQL